MTTLYQEAVRIMNNTDLSEKTKDNIPNELKFIDELKIKSSGLKKLNSKKTIMNYLNKIYKNPRTRKTKIEAIKTLLYNHNGESKLRDYYVDEANKLINPINNIKDKSEYKEEEKEKLVEWSDIVNIKPIGLNHKIFYQFIVKEKLFLRVKGQFTIKLRNYDEDEDNYIKGNKLVINDFKNKRFIGKQEFILKPETMELVNQVEGDYLLSVIKGADFIINFFKRYLGKKIANNLMRKIYINEVMKSNPSNEEIKKRSKRMLNSPQTWFMEYRKVN